MRTEDTNCVYTIFPPRNVAAYTYGALLAQLTYCDKKVSAFQLTAGALPPGTALNPWNGDITVIDPCLLSPGLFSATLIASHTNGNTDSITLCFTIIPNEG